MFMMIISSKKIYFEYIMKTERIYDLGDGARVSAPRPWWLSVNPFAPAPAPAAPEPEPAKTERELFYDLEAVGVGCPDPLHSVDHCKKPYVEFTAHKSAYPYIENGSPRQRGDNMANLRGWCEECRESAEKDGPSDLSARGGGHHNFTVKAKRKKSSKKKRRKSSKTKRRKSSKTKRRKSSKTKRNR